jgi:hypothetical protein
MLAMLYRPYDAAKGLNTRGEVAQWTRWRPKTGIVIGVIAACAKLLVIRSCANYARWTTPPRMVAK